MPVMFVRHEDLLLHPYEVHSTILATASNMSISRDNFYNEEGNSKYSEGHGPTGGHSPLMQTLPDGSRSQTEAAGAAFYRAKLLNASYVWSDQDEQLLDESSWHNLSKRVNHTLLSFFGYHWPRTVPTVPTVPTTTT